MRKIDHYQEAVRSYELILSTKDEDTARGLVKLANTAALISIAGSLRRIAANGTRYTVGKRGDWRGISG